MELTREQLALLELVKSSLFSIAPSIPDDIDWKKIFELAKTQTVIALVEPVVPKFEVWEELADRSKARFLSLLYEQSNLVSKLRECSIAYIILKGTSAAMYYPRPQLRAMGDIDILVKEEKYEEVKKIIEAEGYTFLSKDYRNGTFIKDRIEIELHYRFSSEENDIEALVTKGLEEAVQYQVGNNSFQGPPVLINGLILLDHIRQHLVRSGLGLRQIIDWMMFVHKEIDDNTWENDFRVLASDTGLEKLALTITLLCKKYLGLSGITWCDKADAALMDLLLERLFIDGNFGIDKPKSETVRNNVKSKGFFSYLQNAGKTNWVLAQKYPFFRPFSWLYQLGRYFFKGIGEICHGNNPLKGLKSGVDKDKLLEQLEIDL